MLSRNRPEPTDPLLLSLCYNTTINDISGRYNMTAHEISIILIIHGLQTLYNRYIKPREILLLYGGSYGIMNKYIKVLRNAGLVEKLPRAAGYNVTLDGLTIIRAYETGISRRYKELTLKHEKNWKYLGRNAREQRKRTQYPVKRVKRS